MKYELIKYIPKHRQNHRYRELYGDDFVARFKFIDTYRFRLYNSISCAKLHLFDAESGKIFCGSKLNFSYQFRTQDETQDAMKIHEIEDYCKKCLAKCEIINQ